MAISHQGDYATAATYFHRMTSFFAETGWHSIESSVLAIYAKCLKHLNRKEEYVRILLRLLSKAAGVKRRCAAWTKARCMGEEEVNTDGYVSDLLKYSKQLAAEESRWHAVTSAVNRVLRTV